MDNLTRRRHFLQAALKLESARRDLAAVRASEHRPANKAVIDDALHCITHAQEVCRVEVKE